MKIFIKYKKIFICLVVLGFLAIASSSLAALANWPDSPLGTVLDPSGSKTGQKSTLVDFVKYLYEWGIALGGLAAFVALLIAGFLYVTSTGDPAQMNEAKNRATWAIGGLVLLLSSWLILHVINPELTVLRPLPENFEEDLVAGMGCKTDADCRKWGDTYICDKESKICRQPWEYLLEKKPCDKITIATEGAAAGAPGSPGNEIVLDMGGHITYDRDGNNKLDIILQPGEKFWWWTEPDYGCWGLLNLYEGAETGYRCAKDYQPFLIGAHTGEEKSEMGFGQSNATVFCMEFIEVPSAKIPAYAWNPINKGTEEEQKLDKPTSPYADCPVESYPDVCNMTFTDATGTTGKANWWCYAPINRWSDPNTYRFCVGNTYYSFGCKYHWPTISFRCDPASAIRKICTEVCEPWECQRAYGCVAGSGECICTPTECVIQGGTCTGNDSCYSPASSCNPDPLGCTQCCCVPVSI